VAASNDPAWLNAVTVELANDGEAHILVVLNWETPLIRRWLPTAVNGIGVLLRCGA
jgi:hypothetical protein